MSRITSWMTTTNLGSTVAHGGTSLHANASTPIIMHFPGDYEPGETRQFQLSQELARHRPVYYIRDIAPQRQGRRHLMPRLSLGDRIGNVQVIDRDVGRGFAGIRRRSWRLSAAIQQRQVTRLLRSIGLRNAIFYSIGANGDFAFRRRASGLVIEINDPPFSGSFDAQWHQYRQIASQADLVLATAPALQRLIACGTSEVHLVPNAVRRELIGAHERSPSTTRLTALFVGTIDWRVDLEFVEAVARLVPGWDFVFAGRVNAEAQEAVSALSQMPNVRFLGAVAEVVKVELLKSATLGFIPFLMNAIGDGINPTKVYEFAAYGLPVVATRTDACSALEPIVRCAATPTEAAHLLDHVAQLPSQEEMKAFAMKNTWSDRAQTIEALIAATLGTGR